MKGKRLDMISRTPRTCSQLDLFPAEVSEIEQWHRAVMADLEQARVEKESENRRWLRETILQGMANTQRCAYVMREWSWKAWAQLHDC